MEKMKCLWLDLEGVEDAIVVSSFPGLCCFDLYGRDECICSYIEGNKYAYVHAACAFNSSMYFFSRVPAHTLHGSGRCVGRSVYKKIKLII